METLRLKGTLSRILPKIETRQVIFLKDLFRLPDKFLCIEVPASDSWAMKANKSITDNRTVDLKRESAFTLIESMVGVSIVGMTCLALYSGMTFGVHTLQSARETERATQIVAEKLDTIRLYPWDKIITPGFIPAAFTSPFATTDSKLAELGFPTGGFNYHGTVSIATNISDVDSSYRNITLQVSVSLTWTNGGRTRQASMATLVTRNGLYSYVY